MRTIIKSIYNFFVPKKLKSFIKDLQQVTSYREKTAEFNRNFFLYFRILHYFEHNSSKEYQNEIEYLLKTGKFDTFPYNRTGIKIKNVKNGFDKKKKLPFVIHKDKKLYFPKRFTIDSATDLYTYFIEVENLLGNGGRLEKSPHQYTTDSFYIQNDDIVLDIGTAEGLFLLDAVDKIKKGYIFESDKSWIEALTATFEPYSDKVIIINKLASDKDSEDEITIDTCLKNEFGNIFIKMDTEGYENIVLSGAKNVLNRGEDIRVACCTYHKQGDAKIIENIFNGLNYKYEYSNGYMLYLEDEELKPPYFRKGLIRARKINNIG